MENGGRVLTDKAASAAGERDNGHPLARQEVAPRLWTKTYESWVGGEPLIVVTEGALLRDPTPAKLVQKLIRVVSKRRHADSIHTLRT
jgi:hypothetical protein